MKVTIFILAATLCVALVNANAVGFEKPHPVDLEYIPENSAEGVVGIENYSVLDIFTRFYWVAKGALRTLKGVNCTIKQVMAIKTTSENFIASIQGCGTDAANAFKDVISSVQSVITTCDNIINLNEQVCHVDESTASSKKTSWKCFWKFLSQLNTLNKQIKNTLAAIKKVPSVPAEAATCTTNAVEELTGFFTSFPTTIKTCSKLTS